MAERIDRAKLERLASFDGAIRIDASELKELLEELEAAEADTERLTNTLRLAQNALAYPSRYRSQHTAVMVAINEALGERSADIAHVHAKHELQDLREQLSESQADTGRLDYLDGLNEKLNTYHGTRYGWQVRRNHNRVQLSDSGIPAKTVRQAIDDYRKNPEWGK